MTLHQTVRHSVVGTVLSAVWLYAVLPGGVSFCPSIFPTFGNIRLGAQMAYAESPEKKMHGGGKSSASSEDDVEAPKETKIEEFSQESQVVKLRKNEIIAGIKKRPFRGYSKFQKSFIEVCRSLERDGRKPLLYRLLEENSRQDEQCRACYGLLHSLAEACRVKKPVKKKATEGEAPEVKAVKLAQVPHSSVIDLVSRLFESLACEDPEIRDETTKAVQKFVQVLRDRNGKSREESEYCETLASYIEAPFLPYFEAAKKVGAGVEAGNQEMSGEEKKKALDDLF